MYLRPISPSFLETDDDENDGQQYNFVPFQNTSIRPVFIFRINNKKKKLKKR